MLVFFYLKCLFFRLTPRDEQGTNPRGKAGHALQQRAWGRVEVVSRLVGYTLKLTGQ